MHRHFDQIRKRTVDEQPMQETDPNVYVDFPSNIDESDVSVPVLESVAGSPNSSETEQLPQSRRYPLRTRKAPDRLNL